MENNEAGGRRPRLFRFGFGLFWEKKLNEENHFPLAMVAAGDAGKADVEGEGEGRAGHAGGALAGR